MTSPQEMLAGQRKVLIAVVAGVGVILLLGFGYAFGLIAGVPTPDVTGMDLSQAEAALDEKGLGLGDISYDENAQAAAGSVVSQSPCAGLRSSHGASVSVVVAGTEHVFMPDVAGMTLAEAETAITDVGLGDVSAEGSFHGTVASGSVISQVPSASVEAARGTPVRLIVSKGPDIRSVPDVVGKPREEAVTALEAAGFAAGVDTEDSGSVAKDDVVRQDPEAGTELEAGSSVQLVVSSGVEMVTVPDAERYDTNSEGDADRLLAVFEKLGLKVAWKRLGWTSVPAPEGVAPGDAADRAGSFYGQDPSPGTPVPKNSTVAVTLVVFPPTD